MTRASSVVPYGAYSLGLRIVGAPAASALATLWAAIGAGAFHGTRHSGRAERQAVHLDLVAGVGRVGCRTARP